MIKAEIKGTKSLNKKISILGITIPELVFEEIAKKALEIHADAITGIAKISFGKSILATRKIVSKPGDPPNTQSGVLIGSVRIQVDNAGETASVSSNKKYAVHLEFGTKKMDARPWLQPAIDKNKKIDKKDFKIKRIVEKIA